MNAKTILLSLAILPCTPSLICMQLSPDELSAELRHAIFDNNPQQALKMLIAGADPNANLFGNQCIRLGGKSLHKHLIAAAAIGHTQICKILIERGAKVQDADVYGWTPLLWATQNGKMDVCQLLLAHGASIEEREKQKGNNPLDIAAFEGHEDIVNLLILDYGRKLFLAQKQEIQAQLTSGKESDEVIAQTRAQIGNKLRPLLAHAHELASVHKIKLLLNPNDFGSTFGPDIEVEIRKELGLLKATPAPQMQEEPHQDWNGNNNNQENDATLEKKKKKNCMIQ